jgi:hypothetical protein
MLRMMMEKIILEQGHYVLYESFSRREGHKFHKSHRYHLRDPCGNPISYLNVSDYSTTDEKDNFMHEAISPLHRTMSEILG